MMELRPTSASVSAGMDIALSAPACRRDISLCRHAQERRGGLTASQRRFRANFVDLQSRSAPVERSAGRSCDVFIWTRLKNRGQLHVVMKTKTSASLICSSRLTHGKYMGCDTTTRIGARSKRSTCRTTSERPCDRVNHEFVMRIGMIEPDVRRHWSCTSWHLGRAL